jgi:S-adenosylmethionine hydrolase
VITLLTDFGVESTYPAQMKGVILGRCPSAVIVDLSHGVPRHDVRAAAFMLASAARAFPPGTIHLAVVDPQVGSPRRALAAETCGQVFIAPDNGLLTLASCGGFMCEACDPPVRFYSIENRDHFRTEVSSTFHGRDIFAPVAASISCGARPSDLGPAVDSIVRFNVPQPERRPGAIRGEVLYLDPFGNLVTNIPAKMLEGNSPDAVGVQVSGAVIRGLSKAYSDVPAGWLLAYVGSAGFLEVAVNRQSAASRLGAGVETPVRITLPLA